MSWSLQYGSPPSRFPSRSLCKDRDPPLPKPSLTCLSESPVKIRPSRFPLRSPYVQRKMFHFQSLLLHIFISPQQRIPPSRFPSQCSHRKRPSFSRAFVYLSLKVPGEAVPSPSSPNGAPMQRDSPFPEHSFTCLSKSPVEGVRGRGARRSSVILEARIPSLLS